MEPTITEIGPIYVQYAVFSKAFTSFFIAFESFFSVYDHRGVQYVHWVMHKCIMVKVGGENYMQGI